MVVGGHTVHGLLHPEVGHMLLRPHPDDPIPHGVCPYHDGCLEGLAAGPAIGARVQGDARELPDDHPVFKIEAHYLAQMCQNLIVTVSPEKIILGGGVMQRAALFPMVRAEAPASAGRLRPVRSPAEPYRRLHRSPGPVPRQRPVGRLSPWQKGAGKRLKS